MKRNPLAAPPSRESQSVWSDTEQAAPATNRDVLTISRMAKKFGLTPRALCFYESKGLLAPGREGHGRIYTQADQRQLALILQGRKLGFTIAEIRQMIAAEAGHAAPHTLRMTRERCLEQIEHLETQLRETTEALAELRRMHIALSRT